MQGEARLLIILLCTYLLKLLQLNSRYLVRLLSFGMLLSPSIQPSIVQWRKDPSDDLILTHSPLNPSTLDKVTIPVIIDPDLNSKSSQSPMFRLINESGFLQLTGKSLEPVLPYHSLSPPVEQHFPELQNLKYNLSLVPVYFGLQSVLICNFTVPVVKNGDLD